MMSGEDEREGGEGGRERERGGGEREGERECKRERDESDILSMAT